MGVFTPAGSTYILSESVGLGTSVFTMTATDSDEGPDGEIEYILVSASGKQYRWKFFKCWLERQHLREPNRKKKSYTH